MTEVVPGVHWLKLPMTMEASSLSCVNVYLVSDGDGYLLVDTGWNTKDAMAALQKGLEELGADIRKITRILVTHVHPDHYGMAGRIRELSGARIYLHEQEKSLIGPRYLVTAELLAQMGRWLKANGVPEAAIDDLRDFAKDVKQYVVPSYPDAILHGEETITCGPFRFRVIWTPGHSPGHVCLHEPTRNFLLGGDHILPTITPNIGMHPQSGENPLGRYFESLEAVKKLGVALVLPGHEEPFRNPERRIEEIMRHHQERNGEILRTLAASPKTAYDVAQDVTWGTGGRWQDLQAFHQRMAFSETLAHLELMAANGGVRKTASNGMIYYRKT